MTDLAIQYDFLAGQAVKWDTLYQCAQTLNSGRGAARLGSLDLDWSQDTLSKALDRAAIN